jgi:hypothetical protein
LRQDTAARREIELLRLTIFIERVSVEIANREDQRLRQWGQLDICIMRIYP